MSANRVTLEQDPEIYHKILSEINDSPIGGHPGISNTWDLVNRRYEEPGLRKYTENYMKGCAKCQESKVISNRKCTPLYHFNTHVEQGPFQYVYGSHHRSTTLKQVRFHPNHSGSRML